MASIYKQGRIYWIQYYRDGKRHQESLKTADRGEAKYLKAKRETELKENPNRKYFTKTNARSALEQYHSETAHLKTVHTRINAYIHIRDYLNSFNPDNLTDITEASLRAYLTNRLNEGSLGLITANNIIRSVKTFLTWQVAQGNIAHNPLSQFKQYRENRTPPKFLTIEERDKFLKAAKGSVVYPAIATGLYAGLRLGELKRLSWNEIDFDKNIITVKISKSGKFRTVPLNENLKAILEPIARRLGDKQSLCFDLKNQQREIERVSEKAEIKARWHTLRHTFASLLAQSGVSIYKIAKWLGHSTTRTTELYAHLQPNSDSDINRL